MRFFIFQINCTSLIFSLGACDAKLKVEANARPSNSVLQKGGLWESTIKVVKIEGIDEEQSARMVSDANAKLGDGKSHQCLEQMIFSERPRIGDESNVGEEQGLICKYDRVEYSSNTQNNHLLCKNIAGEDVAKITMQGEIVAGSSAITSETAYLGGVTTTVFHSTKWIGPCPDK